VAEGARGRSAERKLLSLDADNNGLGMWPLEIMALFGTAAAC
jgi:hypothetical protein